MTKEKGRLDTVQGDRDWAAPYREHFIKHFERKPRGETAPFALMPGSPESRIAEFDLTAPPLQNRSTLAAGPRTVFPGCHVFCSLGLSNYQAEVGCVAEIMLPGNDGWEQVPNLLGCLLQFLAQNGNGQVQPGVLVPGVDAIDPDFSARFGKSAVALALPSWRSRRARRWRKSSRRRARS